MEIMNFFIFHITNTVYLYMLITCNPSNLLSPPAGVGGMGPPRGQLAPPGRNGANNGGHYAPRYPHDEFQASCLLRTPEGNVYIPSGEWEMSWRDNG